MEALEWLFGAGVVGSPGELLRMLARALLVFGWALLLYRLGKRRLFGRYVAYDFLLAVMLAAMMSRAINGPARLLDTLAVSTVLVGLHWLVTLISSRSPGALRILKGEARVLVRDGEIDREALRDSHLSEHDLLQFMRLEGHLEELQQVKLAVLERNGEISIIPRWDRSEHTSRAR